MYRRGHPSFAGAVGGDDDGDDKEKEEEAERERQEAIREAEERRKEKHRKMEEEREKMRQEIRDKVREFHGYGSVSVMGAYVARTETLTSRMCVREGLRACDRLGSCAY
jgi:fructose-1,6-bisphosphatase/inositol monophosphatase family enzyme